MGGMLGKGLSKQPTTISSLQFQTAQKGGVIPLVWGATRVAGNLVDYDDFQHHSSSAKGGGKGGATGKGQSQTTYSATGIFAICQGPIEQTGVVWWDQNYGGLDPALATLYVGNDGQTPDPTYASAHPDKAIGYSGTAVVVANNLNLGNSAAMPNFTFEVVAIDALADAPHNLDCKPATIVTDFLTNARYGAGFPSANLGDLSDYEAYCDAVGIWLSPQLDTAQPAQQLLSDIAQITNSAIVWSGDKLKIIPYGDADISVSHTVAEFSGSVTAGTVISLTFTDAGLSGSPLTVSYTVIKQDVDFLILAVRHLAKVVNSNAALGAFGITAIAGGTGILIRQEPAGSIGISGAGVTVTAGPTVVASFTPDVTPLYSLTDDDFIVSTSSVGSGGMESGGAALRSGGGTVIGASDDPVKIERTSPADADNLASVEYLDRSNFYNTEVAETSDQAAIDAYGLRRGSPIAAHAITNVGTAQRVAQLLLNRAQLYRRRYTFRLGWKYCLLEPGDLVEITDPRLGASALVVRITSIEEDDEGTLTVTAEDFLPGSSVPVTYPSQVTGGGAPNHDIAAGDVNEPLIIAPPSALTNGAPQIWIGASGGPDWGSAQIYISLDDVSYTPFGQITAPVRQGDTTASLPSTSSPNPDSVNTLSVDLSESRGELTSVSSDNAAAFATLCWVDGELLAYATATLTGTNEYDLTELYRGAYGSPISSHSSGSRFARIDDAVGRFDLPPNMIGQTLYFKFVSANIYGGGQQDLAGVTAYPFSFNPDSDPLWDELLTGADTDLGSITETLAVTSDLGSVAGAVTDTIDFGGI